MLSRILFALKISWQYRAQLRAYGQDPTRQLPTITQLKPEYLVARQVEALVLDFDGVLAAHAEPIPAPEVVGWLQDFSQHFVPNTIYILSNKPTQSRLDYFSANLPALKFIVAKRKKPYPDGLEQIIADSGLRPEQILLADDRLCTGIVAAIACGVQTLRITAPYVNFRARPIRESFFACLRWLEQSILT